MSLARPALVIEEEFLALPETMDQVPQLCVEVLSTNRAYDRLTKRFVYAAAGVEELWIVEPSGLVERWQGPELSQAEELTEGLTTPLLAGFHLDLTTLFRVG